MSTDAVIAAVSRLSVKLWDEGSHIFPSVRIAQCLHETGGNLNPWNNLVGFKAAGSPGPYWDGAYVVKGTWEVIRGSREDVNASFRAYTSIEQCLRDHDRLLRTPHYKQVWEATSPEDQCVALMRCGYATDPKYHEKMIHNWLRPMGLKRFDVPRKPSKQEGVGKPMNLSETSWQALYEALNAMYHGSVEGRTLPVMNDYTYAAKAADRVLNTDELLTALTIAMQKALEARP